MHERANRDESINIKKILTAYHVTLSFCGCWGIFGLDPPLTSRVIPNSSPRITPNIMRVGVIMIFRNKIPMRPMMSMPRVSWRSKMGSLLASGWPYPI